MQIRTITTIPVFACLLSGGSGCGSSPSTAPDPTAFGQKYKIADNQIPGWTQDPDPDTYWTGTDLVAAGIDGGNVAYDDRGFRQGMFQTLNGPVPQVCNLRAMDFDTESNATTMFLYAQKINSATVPIPSFDASTAIGETVLGGADGFAHFKASYFELYLTGYADPNAAIADATLFLQVLQSDTK